MFNYFRALLSALEGIVDAVLGVSVAVHALTDRSVKDSALADRVAALELELERRHAEAEGLLLRAEGKLKASRAAEERERRLSESRNGDQESDQTELEDILAAYEAAGVPLDDEGGGGAEELPAMSSAMGARLASKESAYAMKWRGR